MTLPGGSDVESAKAALKMPLPKQGGGPDTRLAVIVVQPDAVRPAKGTESFGTYELFVRARLDDRLLTDLHTGLRDAIVARGCRALASIRPESGASPVPRPESRTVTAEGERATNMAMNMLMPWRS